MSRGRAFGTATVVLALSTLLLPLAYRQWQRWQRPPLYILQRDLPPPRGIHPGELALDAEGRRLGFTMMNGGPLFLQELDLVTGPEVIEGAPFSGAPAFMSGTERIAIGSSGAVQAPPLVSVLDRKSGRIERSLQGNGDWGYELAWSPDGRLLACGNAHGSTQLWEPGQTAPAIKLAGTAPAFSPDGKTLATGEGHVVRMWDTATWALRATFTLPTGVPCSRIRFDRTGRLLAACGGFTWSSEERSGALGGIGVWRLSDGKALVLSERDAPAFAIAVSADPDEVTVLWGSRLELLRGSDGTLIEAADLRGASGGAPWSVSLSADGRTVASTRGMKSIGIWRRTR